MHAGKDSSACLAHRPCLYGGQMESAHTCSVLTWTWGLREHLIQNVDGGGLEEQHGQNERQCEEGTLAAAELCQGLLPDIAKCHTNLQPCTKVIA